MVNSGCFRLLLLWGNHVALEAASLILHRGDLYLFCGCFDWTVSSFDGGGCLVLRWI